MISSYFYIRFTIFYIKVIVYFYIFFDRQIVATYINNK